ncbi:hypothetical protein QTN25_009984 [Entamoeba marina]
MWPTDFSIVDVAYQTSEEDSIVQDAPSSVQTSNLVNIIAQPIKYLPENEFHALLIPPSSNVITIVSYNEHTVTVRSGSDVHTRYTHSPIICFDQYASLVACATQETVLVLNVETLQLSTYNIPNVTSICVNRGNTYNVYCFGESVTEIDEKTHSIYSGSSFISLITTSIFNKFGSRPPKVLKSIHNPLSQKLYTLSADGSVSVYSTIKRVSFLKTVNILKTQNFIGVRNLENIFCVSKGGCDICIISGDNYRFYYDSSLVLKYVMPSLKNILFVDNGITITSNAIYRHCGRVEEEQTLTLPPIYSILPSQPIEHSYYHCFDRNPTHFHTYWLLTPTSIISARILPIIPTPQTVNSYISHYGSAITGALLLKSNINIPPPDLFTATITLIVWTLNRLWKDVGTITELVEACDELKTVSRLNDRIEILQIIIDALEVEILRRSYSFSPLCIRSVIEKEEKIKKDVAILASKGCDVSVCGKFLGIENISKTLMDRLSKIKTFNDARLIATDMFDSLISLNEPLNFDVISELCFTGQYDIAVILSPDIESTKKVINRLYENNVRVNGFEEVWVVMKKSVYDLVLTIEHGKDELLELIEKLEANKSMNEVFN